MNYLPTTRQMQYLVALDEYRSFQKAAESCAVTQSTLSAGIKELETILGSPLINREQRKIVRFTSLGQVTVQEARGVIARMEALTYRARRMNETLSWPLKLGVIPTIAPYLLPRLLKPLKKALPALELHIYEMRSGQIVEKLQDGELDLGLLAFPFDLKGLERRDVMEESFVCAAPPKHFEDRKSIAMKDLQEEKLLLLEDGHCLRDHALDACRLRPMAEMKTLSASSLSTLIQMVHQGYGITFLPEMAVQDNAMLPRSLSILPIRGEAPSRMIGFAWKPHSLREKDIRTACDAMETLMRSGQKAKKR